ncbi:hypothetical protein BJX64DRAFT_77626 [Aspergillus heterothallicus]
MKRSSSDEESCCLFLSNNHPSHTLAPFLDIKAPGARHSCSSALFFPLRLVLWFLTIPIPVLIYLACLCAVLWSSSILLVLLAVVADLDTGIFLVLLLSASRSH